MIDVALLRVIRRWHLREGVSIREIARSTELSRNTIPKCLADGTLQPAYPKRNRPRKLDPYSEMLASWLERKSTRGPKRRRKGRQLLDGRVGLGYRGAYDRVAAFARAVPAADVESPSEAIVDAMRNRDRSAVLAEAAFRRVTTNFSAASMAAKYHSMCRAAMRR